MVTPTFKDLLRTARALRLFGVSRARLSREDWRATVRDQARLSMSTAMPSKQAGSIPKEPGWWLERNAKKRAQLEREVMALPVEPEACPTCDGAKWVLTGPFRREPNRPARDVVRCPACNQPSPTELMDAAGIPKRYRTATFETFTLAPGKVEAAEAVRGWASAGDPDSMIIIGQPGRGKTHLAIAAVKALVERGVECKFVQASALIDELKSSFDGGNTEALFERYRKVLVLVLDDIGAARPTEWARDRIAALIEARLNDELPTVITSDKGAAELLDMGYDARMVSRLRTYTVVRVEGDDMRGRKR